MFFEFLAKKIAPILRYTRDLKYHFTKNIYLTNYGFKLWLQNKPNNKNLVDLCEVNVFKKFIPKSDLFVDIGANIGFFSILANKINKRINIISVEPNNYNFQLLQKNFKLNSIKKYRLYNYGASDKNCKMKLYGHGQGASLKYKWGGIYNYSKIIKVKKTKFFFKDVKYYNSIFLKIDVEGHELEVIKGLSRRINNKIKFIMFENGIKKNFNYKNYNFLKIFLILQDNFYFFFCG